MLSEEQLAERLSTLEKTQEAFTSGQSKAFYLLSTSSAALILLSASLLLAHRCLLLCYWHTAYATGTLPMLLAHC